MSRADQYRVTRQPEIFDAKKDSSVPTISQADLSSTSRNRESSSSSCMAQLCDSLSVCLCCFCLGRMCESNPDCSGGCDNCGECDCTGCDC